MGSDSILCPSENRAVRTWSLIPYSGFFRHVSSRRRFDLAIRFTAEHPPRRNLLSAVPREPRAPVRPPAPGLGMRFLEPALGILQQAPAQPVISLVLRHGIYDTGNVAARGQHEFDFT